MALTTTTDFPQINGIPLLRKLDELGNTYLKAVARHETYGTYPLDIHECTVIQRLSEAFRTLKSQGEFLPKEIKPTKTTNYSGK